MADRESLLTYKSQLIIQEDPDKDLVQPLSNPQTSQSTVQKQRLKSLDILRGLTMFGMIIVDCRGPQAPWFIKHVSWDGLSPADFIFPSFVFIMGMAVPLAISQKKPFSLRTFVRIVGLFAIGLLLNLADQRFNFGEFRVPGILQRLSICYLLVAAIHFLTKYANKAYRYIGVILAICIGLIYLIFMLTFENAEIGCYPSNNLSKFCNFGSYWDRKIFGENHMIYPNDPEGLFTNLSAFLNGFIGYLFALIMLDHKQNKNKTLIFWTLFSLLLGAMVYPLTIMMPLNKKIWSMSFVFLTAATTGLSLVFFTYLIDFLGKKNRKLEKFLEVITKPFLWLGLNPLAIFVLMEALAIILASLIIINGKSAAEHFYVNVFKSWISNGEVASVVFPFFFSIIWIIAAGLLFKFKIFVRL